MNPSCFTLIVAAVFLQICTSTAQEDFSQFEQQFKQLSEALGGGGAAVDAGAAADVGAGPVDMGNASVAAGGVQNDAPPAAAPEQPSPEPTRVPKPEEASTFPPLSRQDAKGNSTEKPKDAAAATTPKSSTPKGDGGAGFAAANCALVLGVAGVLRLLY